MENKFYKRFSARLVRGFVLGLMLFMGLTAFGQTTVFTEAFGTAADGSGNYLGGTSTPSVTYIKTSTATTPGVITTAGGSYYLNIQSGSTSSPTTYYAGRTYLTGTLATFSSPYDRTLHSTGGLITWTFNIRNSKTTNPLNGFGDGSQACAVVLAADNVDLLGGSTQGYAVTLNGGSGANKIDLGYFTKGLGGSTDFQSIVTLSGTLSNVAYTNYASVKVTYNSVGDVWSLYVRDDGSSSFGDPTTVPTTTAAGTGTDGTTLKTTQMSHFGYFLNHPTNNNSTRFDNIKITVTPTPTPAISVPTPTSLSGFFYSGGAGPSPEKTFTVGATNLSANLIITPPTNYEVSLSSGSGFVSSPSTLPITPSSGTVATTTIYVRLKAGLADATYNNEDINITSTGATARTVTCNGSVSSTATVIVSTASLSAFPNTAVGSNSTSSNFTVSGSNLGANNITITPPTNFELSTDNMTFSTSAITLTPSSGTVASTPIYARYTPTGSGAYSGNIAVSSTASGVTTQNVAVSGYISKFYYKGGGLASTANWAGKADLMGTSVPNDFATAGVSYVLLSSATTDAIWTVSGTGSKVIVGDPLVSAVTLTIDTLFKIVGTIDIPAASSGSNSLILKDPNFPTFGTLNALSEVHLQASITLTGSTTFGKVFIDSGDPTELVLFTGQHTVVTSLTVAANSVMQGSGTPANYTVVSGAVVTINGTFRTNRTGGFVSSGITPSGNANFGHLQFSGAENLTLGAASTIQYEKTNNNTTNQIVMPRADYANLTIIDGIVAPTSANSKTLASATTVSGTLTINQVFTGSTFTISGALTVGTLALTAGKIVIGANTLTATTITGGSSTAYVVTDGAGVLTSPTIASTLKLFPIGTASSYDPVEVTPTTGVNFSASVTAAAPSSVSDNTKMAQRVWNISATGAGSTVMSLTNGGSAYTPTVASMGHYKSNNTWEEFITGTTYSANKWTATNTSGSFSPFGGGEAGAFNNAVLSVEFTNFQAKTYQKSTLLTWTTASEKDNAVFNIEQSTNGTDFQTVGQVKGHGTTTASNSYNYEHTTPSVGINYYRLKQVDFNGTATYSAVRSVLFGKTGLVVKSTLVHDALDVVTSDDTATPLSIFNTAGQQVFTGKVQGAQRLSVSTLPAGLYIVRTNTGDVARFVKN